MSDEVRAAAAGDVGAYERLVRAHAARVVAVTLAVTGDPALAEDAAQDAFVLGWRRVATLDEPAAFGAWIRQIARNRARDLVRTAARRARAVPVEDGVVARGPEEELASAQDRSRVRDALAALPEEARELLVRHYRDEESTAVIAEDLGLTDAAVRQRLQRARDQLRGELAPIAEALRRSAPGAAFQGAVLASVRAAPAQAARPSRALSWGLGIAALAGIAGLVGVAWLASGPGTAPVPSGPERTTVVPGVPSERGGGATRVTVPAPTAPDEAFAALAGVAGGTVVRCPAAGLPPRPEGPPHLRVVGGGAWFLADAPAGRAVVWPGLSVRRLSEGEVARVSADPEPGPTLVRWSPAGCAVERPAPVQFRARAPGAVVAMSTEDGHCVVAPAAAEGSWDVTAYAGVGCLLTTVDGAWSAWVSEPVSGASVELQQVPPPQPVEMEPLSELLAQAVVDSFAPDDVLSRALATPGLSAEAAELLSAWQEADAAAAEQILHLFDAAEEP